MSSEAEIFFNNKSSIKFHKNAFFPPNKLCEFIILPVQTRVVAHKFFLCLLGIVGPDTFHVFDLITFQNPLGSSVFANCIY